MIVKHHLLQISIASPWGSETIELAEVELFIVSTNETERQLAIAKYTELQETASMSSSRSKSKSPRRKRSDRADEEEIPPSPAVHGALANIGNTPTASSPAKAPPPRKPNPRRPHTSAGPRDKPISFAGGVYARPRGREEEPSTAQMSSSRDHPSQGTSVSNAVTPASKRRSDFITRGPTTSYPDPKEGHGSSSTPSKRGLFGNATPNRTQPSSFIGGPSGGTHNSKLSSSSFWSTVHTNPNLTSPKMKEAPSGSSTTTTDSMMSVKSTSSCSSVERDSPIGTSKSGDHIREWEEELARIEKRSRKSSDLLSMFRRKKSIPDLSSKQS